MIGGMMLDCSDCPAWSGIDCTNDPYLDGCIKDPNNDEWLKSPKNPEADVIAVTMTSTSENVENFATIFFEHIDCPLS